MQDIEGVVINQYDEIVTIQLLRPCKYESEEHIIISREAMPINMKLRGLWKVFTRYCANQIGYKQEEMEIIFKKHCGFTKFVKGLDGSMFEIVRSTKNGDCDDKELGNLFEQSFSYALSFVDVFDFQKKYDEITGKKTLKY